MDKNINEDIKFLTMTQIKLLGQIERFLDKHGSESAEMRLRNLREFIKSLKDSLL